MLLVTEYVYVINAIGDFMKPITTAKMDRNNFCNSLHLKENILQMRRDICRLIYHALAICRCSFFISTMPVFFFEISLTVLPPNGMLLQ